MSQAELVDTFFRRHPSSPVPRWEARPRLKVADVPQNQEGLLTLAKSENWGAVGHLAEMLEKQLNLSSSDFTVKEQRLKLVQVRVTAAIKMQDYSKATALVEDVGGISALKGTSTSHSGREGGSEHSNKNSSPSYVDPSSGRSVVPFSLLFLAVWVYVKQAHLKPPPAQQGASAPTIPSREEKDGSLQVMYDLLDECVEQEKASLDGSFQGSTRSEALRWQERQRRVRRALVMAHFERQEFEPSVMHLNALVDMATDVQKQMLLMQQVGCLALRCGNSVVANEAFSKMKNLLEECDEEEATPEAKSFCKYLSEMNDSLSHLFFGEYDAAVEKLRKLMITHPFTGKDCTAEDESSGGNNGGDDVSLRASPEELAGMGPRLIGPTLYNTMAANGYIVCHQYASDGDKQQQQYNLKQAVLFAEKLLKRHPKQVLKSNGSLYNIKALHHLEDDQSVDKVALMKAVIDAFRCGPECNADAIVP